MAENTQGLVPQGDVTDKFDPKPGDKVLVRAGVKGIEGDGNICEFREDKVGKVFNAKSDTIIVDVPEAYRFITYDKSDLLPAPK